MDVIVLGATGSIGRQTADVIRSHPDRLRARGLVGRRDWSGMLALVRLLQPDWVYLADPEAAARVRDALPGSVAWLAEPGEVDGAIAAAPAGTAVVAAMSGLAGLDWVMTAAAAGLRLCLANKETLVAAGAPVTDAVRRHGATLLPVDSEHSALMQAIGRERDAVARLILTCSGGPFRGWSPDRLEAVTVAEALRHPTWRMGAKITIDSATLMNKGLEIIEATWLFGLPEDRIDVVIHPQSVVHSLAEMEDGSVLAQLGPPDMRLPIQLALSWPERWSSAVDRLNLAQLGTLEFFPPDHQAFPAIGLAREASRRGGTFPAVLNAANEEGVGRFLAGDIRFSDIWRLVQDVLERWAGGPADSLGAVKEADQWARRAARAWKAAGKGGRPC
jgi:1-deoxy-D-xylulose-5-phosphate reductoisomerase